jgi:hypothetical protein
MTIKKYGPNDVAVELKFGGGLHTRASEDEIDAREASDGQNFVLDLDNRELRPRAPFDLVGTVPGSGSVLGGGSLLKSDGTVSTLFQRGGTVCEWNGGTGFSPVGTCNSASKLRGNWRAHNWMLSDKVLFSDLTLNDVVKEWDGTTFQSVSFTDTSGAAFGSFGAKYIDVSNERVLYANVKDHGTSFPHLMVGSAQSNYLMIDTSNQPSSSLSTGDPFYMVIPDLKPINGLVGAFGTRILSTEKGSLFKLDGTTAKDFAFSDYYLGSAASGNQSLAYIGNDIIYGRQGRIESVRDTAAFGNSEAIDLSLIVADQLEDFTGWTTVFNGRKNLVYMFPEDESEVWVFNTAMRTSRLVRGDDPTDQFVDQTVGKRVAGKLSPWMRWTTAHPLAFQPTFVDSMLDPATGLECVFMGDSGGNIYRLEGVGDSGDGGINNIQTSWTSKLFSAPLDAEVFTLEGHIKYRKQATESVVTITIMYAGRVAFDKSTTLTLPATEANYFGDTIYFGGNIYFGATFQDRLIRQYFRVPGQSNDFQVRIEVDGVNTFNINEVHLRMRAASQ